MTIRRALLMLSLLLAVAGARAQEPADPNQPADTAADERAATDAQSEEPPARERSPFEYEASEQISEDLSVSFPVDI